MWLLRKVRPGRLERPADGFVDRPSIQLRYGRRMRQSAQRTLRLARKPAFYRGQRAAGRQGFEPWVELMALQPLSRRPRSTTPAPPHTRTRRRERDSNPRILRSTVFKTAAIDHSAIPPDSVEGTSPLGSNEYSRAIGPCQFAPLPPDLRAIETQGDRRGARGSEHAVGQSSPKPWRSARQGAIILVGKPGKERAVG